MGGTKQSGSVRAIDDDENNGWPASSLRGQKLGASATTRNVPGVRFVDASTSPFPPEVHMAESTISQGESPLVYSAEVESMTGRDIKTIDNWVRIGRFPAPGRINRRKVWRRQVVNDWLRAQLGGQSA
jgi:predicted DNA-binding transcriptional regulator AlpA